MTKEVYTHVNIIYSSEVALTILLSMIVFQKESSSLSNLIWSSVDGLDTFLLNWDSAGSTSNNLDLLQVYIYFYTVE